MKINVEPASGDRIRQLNGSKIKKCLLILTAFVLACAALTGMLGTFPWNAALNAGLPEGQGLDPGSPAEITTSFRIDSDEELEAKADEVGWKGSGTLEDPFIIYNVNIAAGASDFGIFIGNTTSSFIIYRCQIGPLSTYVGPASGNIVLYNVTHATVRETSVRNSFVGTSVIGCRNVTLIDLTGNGMSRQGVFIDASSNVSMLGGSFSDCRDGAGIERSNNVMIENVSIGCVGSGIRAQGCGRIAISNVTADDGSVGIDIGGSSNVSVEGSSILRSLTGVECCSSSDITVRDCSITDCGYGVKFDHGSTSSVIAGNSITGCCEAGVLLSDSPGNVIHGNTLARCSILLNGTDMRSYTEQDIAANNTVNGKPVCYCRDLGPGEGMIPLDAGQVILANVTGLEIGGLDLGEQNVGVLMAFCSGVVVRESTFVDMSSQGIIAYNCTGSAITGNAFSYCGPAVHIVKSDRMIIEMNDITGCTDGIALEESGGCLVRDNTVVDCSNSGISILRSPGNELYGNALLRCSFFLFGDDSLSGDQTIAANNTVNGMPVYHYYDVDMNGASVPLDAGQVILWSVRNATVSGLDLGHQNFGLIMGHCHQVTVVDNIIRNCTCSAIILYSCTDCLIDGNSMSDSANGVTLDRCADCVISNNTAEGCINGIYLDRSSGIEARNNTLIGVVAMKLFESDNTIVSGNRFQGNTCGIELTGSGNNIISDNRLDGCSTFGIVIDNGAHDRVENNTLAGNEEGICLLSGTIGANVSGNDLSDCRIGILLNGSLDVRVGGNTINGGQVGILAAGSEAILIDGNTVSNSSFGISVSAGQAIIDGNRINGCGTGIAIDAALVMAVGNDISGGDKGIEVRESSGCALIENYISGCSSSGIWLDGCHGCLLGGNVMTGCSIVLGGDADEVASSDILPNNAVNGRPVYYYANAMMDDITVPADAGEVILASVTDCVVRGLGFGNGTVAVQICYSENITIEECTFDNMTLSAILLNDSGNVTIGRCTFVRCEHGVRGDHQRTGIAVDNSIFVLCPTGILCSGGSNCSVANDTFIDCGSGIEVRLSDSMHIVDNRIDGSHTGIIVVSNSTVIGRNHITNCTDAAIDVRGEHNSVSDNHVDGAAAGVRLRECYFNVVERNDVRNCTVGVTDALSLFDVVRHNLIQCSGAHGILVEDVQWTIITNNTVKACGTGLTIRDSGFAFVVENLIEHCGSGIGLDTVETAYLELNTVSASAGVGIGVHRSQNVSVSYSVITDCASYGIAFTESENNEAFLNRFIENNGAGDIYDPDHAQAYGDDPSTEWAVDGQGNYWSDLTGPDAERDGYVDSEYLIAGGNADPRPLSQLIAGPGNLTADALHDRVTLTWSESNYSLPGPIDGYFLTRNSSAGGNFTVHLGPEAASYEDTSVDPYTTYTYTLVASSGGVVGGPAIVEVLTPDPFPPTVVIRWPSESLTISSTDAVICWEGSDPYSGIASYWVKVNDGEWLNAGLDESFVLRDLSEGGSTIYVKAVAMAGNTAVAQVNITVDTIPPSVTITSPANGSRTSSPVLTWTGSDNGTCVSYELFLDGGARTVATSANEFRFDPLDQGRHIVQVRAIDAAGNCAVAEVQFYYDAVSPFLADRGPSGRNATVDTKVWVTFSEEMNRSSVSVFVSGVAGTGSWSGNTLTLVPSAPLRAGASYTVTVSGTDLAGNRIDESWTFSVATTATVTGQVLDADGRPLAGAVVALENGRTAVTDHSGAFSLEMENGQHDITISKPGYLRMTSTVFLSPGQSISLGAVALSEDRSGDIYWAAVDVLAIVAVLAVLLFICRRR